MISEILGQTGNELFRELEYVDRKINSDQAFFTESNLTVTDLATLPQGEQWAEFYRRTVWAAYVASASAILRAHIWSCGMVDAYRASNYFSFCANLRGLIESTADTLYTFDNLPDLLTLNFPGLNSVVLNGKPVPPVRFDELGDKISHFIHATERDPSPDPIPPLRSSEYMGIYDKACPGARTLYGDLCQLTHPSAQSVYWMLEADTANATKFIGTTTAGSKIIEFLDMHKDRISLSIILGLTNPLVTLKILSLLRMPALKLDFMDAINLNAITRWPELRKRLGSP